MEGARSGGSGLGGILVILGIVLAIVWSVWWGLIIGLVGLIFFAVSHEEGGTRHVDKPLEEHTTNGIGHGIRTRSGWAERAGRRQSHRRAVGKRSCRGERPTPFIPDGEKSEPPVPEWTPQAG
jgi:hypothetical protein